MQLVLHVFLLLRAQCLTPTPPISPNPAAGIIMVGVIVGSKKTGVNPDNVATPIAASFGDLITLAILAWISQGLYKCLGGFTRCLSPLCISLVLAAVYLGRETSWVWRFGGSFGKGWRATRKNVPLALKKKDKL